MPQKSMLTTSGGVRVGVWLGVGLELGLGSGLGVEQADHLAGREGWG